jgi:hypothetical protein
MDGNKEETAREKAISNTLFQCRSVFSLNCCFPHHVTGNTGSPALKSSPNRTASCSRGSCFYFTDFTHKQRHVTRTMKTDNLFCSLTKSTMPRSRVRGAIPPLPQYAYMVWCSVKRKYKDNFTLSFSLKKSVD